MKNLRGAEGFPSLCGACHLCGTHIIPFTGSVRTVRPPLNARMALELISIRSSILPSSVAYWMFTMCKALSEELSTSGSLKKTAVILPSCFAFLGSGLSCIGPQESLSYLIVFCPNWERLTTACCFSARWRLSWPSWRITLLFGTSFTCASMVSAGGISLKPHYWKQRGRGPWAPIRSNDTVEWAWRLDVGLLDAEFMSSDALHMTWSAVYPPDTPTQISQHPQQLTTIYNSSAKDYSALFWPPGALHTCDIHAHRQSVTHTTSNIRKFNRERKKHLFFFRRQKWFPVLLVFACLFNCLVIVVLVMNNHSHNS